MRSPGLVLASLGGLGVLLLASQAGDLWLVALVVASIGGGLAMQWLQTKATAETGRIVAGLVGSAAVAALSVGLIWEALTFTPQPAVRLGLLVLATLGLSTVAFGLFWMLRAGLARRT